MSGSQGLIGGSGAGAERIEGRRVARAFGEVLQRLRQERGLSQEALAFEAEIDRTYPSLMERGRRHPTLTMLLRLSRALIVDPTRRPPGFE